MNNHFKKAFEGLDSCFCHIGKGIEEVVKDITKESSEGVIVLKRGTKVYLEDGSVCAILQKDVEAIIAKSEEPEDISNSEDLKK